MEGNHQYCREIPSVLLRNAIQYCGGCSVLWRDTVSTVDEYHSTVKDVQYDGGKPSVRQEDTISAVEERHSVLWRMFSTVEGYSQYCGGCSLLWRNTTVLSKVLSTMEGNHHYCGEIPSVQWRDAVSNVEDIQCAQGKHNNCGDNTQIAWDFPPKYYTDASLEDFSLIWNSLKNFY